MIRQNGCLYYLYKTCIHTAHAKSDVTSLTSAETIRRRKGQSCFKFCSVEKRSSYILSACGQPYFDVVLWSVFSADSS